MAKQHGLHPSDLFQRLFVADDVTLGTRFLGGDERRRQAQQLSRLGKLRLHLAQRPNSAGGEEKYGAKSMRDCADDALPPRLTPARARAPYRYVGKDISGP